jgi:glycosyltransferase involved in cell wall biosynthesis
MRFSVCVCTFNRAHILPYCLDSLTKLKIPLGAEVEILVIDNNSTDHTREVVDRYARLSPIAMRYLHEGRQGLSIARNRAIDEARGDYLGFLDDECVVRPDWLEIAAADIDEFAPYIIGGPFVGAILPGDAPRWFKTEYGDAYFFEKLERGYHKEFRAAAGNMFLHRRVCEAERFDSSLGPKANEMGFGEETYLQDHFLSENSDAMVFYEPRLVVAHYILPHKMSLRYFARRRMEIAACHHHIALRNLPVELIWSLAYLVLSAFRLPFRDRQAYPYWQNYIYEKVIPTATPVFGVAFEKFRRRYRDSKLKLQRDAAPIGRS